MKPTPKADELIRMISDIEEFVSLLNIPIKTGKQFAQLSNRAEYLNLLIKYRLFGNFNIDYKGDTSFKKFKGESMPEDFNSFVSENLSLQSSNILEQVLKDYDPVTIEDLKQEFWTIIPSIDQIENSYSFIKIKFKEVFSKFPDSKDYNYFKLINDENFISAYEIIGRSEVEQFLLKVSFIVEHLNTVSELIISTYKGFIVEANPLSLRQELIINDSQHCEVFEQPEENNFIISTIEDHLESFKEFKVIDESNYKILIESLIHYFDNGTFPMLNSIIKVGRVNKKSLGWSLRCVFADMGKGVEIELLKFAKNNISCFNDAKFDEDEYLKSNLYKYFTTKT